MDQKKKIRVVVIIPVVVTLLVLAGVVTLVLIASSAKPTTEVTAVPFEGMSGAAAGADLPVGVANAPGSIGANPGYAGDGVPPQEVAGPSCAFDFLIGQTSDQAVAQISPLGRPYRVLSPGMMVTQDYSAERINLMIDENGIVQSVDCG
ncbi:MAG: I78 family peptidase inhibitor [Micavibrio sp.]